MSRVNPLKSCNDINSFNKFAKQLKVDAKGHHFTYEASNGKTHSYTLNQITYQFNKCRKSDESALTQKLDVNSKMEMIHWENLGKKVNEGLYQINKLAKNMTPNWKTSIKDALFAVTHKGFNREVRLQKIQMDFPKTLAILVDQIGSNLPLDSSFADLDSKFKSEGYSLESLILSNELGRFIMTPVGRLLFKEAKAGHIPSPMNEIIKTANLDFKIKELLRIFLPSESPKPKYRAQVFTVLESSLKQDGYLFEELINQESFVEMLKNSKLKDEFAARVNEIEQQKGHNP